MHKRKVSPPQPLPAASPARRTVRHKDPAPPYTCWCCGGSWFRTMIFYRYPKSQLNRHDPTQTSVMRMRLAVCLCGRARCPNIGGIRGGRTNRNLACFYDGLCREDAFNNPDAVPDLLRHGLLPRSEYEAMKRCVAASRQADRTRTKATSRTPCQSISGSTNETKGRHGRKRQTGRGRAAVGV